MVITVETDGGGGVGSNHTHHSFSFDIGGSVLKGRPAGSPFPLGSPTASLSTPLLMLVSFQGRVIMKSSPSDVCSSEAAGRVGHAAEQAKASSLQTG